MVVLVVHGLHQETSHLDINLCGEYVRRYRPTRGQMTFIEIVTKATYDDPENSVPACDEIKSSIEVTHPAAVIEFRYSPSLNLDLADSFSPERVEEFLASREHDSDFPLGRKTFRDAALRLRNLDAPVQVYPGNPSVSRRLLGYVAAQRDLCNLMPTSGSTELLSRQSYPQVEYATSARIPYMCIFANVHFAEGKVVQDDRFKQSSERTIELLERLRGHINSAK